MAKLRNGQTRRETYTAANGRTRTVTIVGCCGAEIECSGFTNTCDRCGADFNWNGHRLAAREQWGEETGEHPAEIARIP